MCQRKLVLLISALFWFSLNTYAPYQTPYLMGMGYVATLVGIILGANGMIQMILRFPLGIFADLKKQHKSIIMLGVAFTGVAAVVRLLLPNAIGYFMGNLLSGLAATTWISFMVFFPQLYESHEMQKANGLLIASSNGGGLAAFIVGTIVYEKFGMQMLCMISALATIPALILCTKLKEQKVTWSRVSWKEVWKICLNRRLLVFSLIAMVQQGILAATAISFTIEHARSIGATSYELGSCSILYMIAAVVFAYCSSKQVFIARSTRFWFHTILIGLGIYCIWIPNTTSIYEIYVVQLLVALSQGILFGYATSEAMADVPIEKRSTAMGFYQAIFAIGITIYPMIVGILSDRWNLAVGYYVIGGSCLIALGVLQWFYRSQRRES